MSLMIFMINEMNVFWREIAVFRMIENHLAVRTILRSA